MRAVLISIQPKWCKLIIDGKKTIEVRKTKPRLETPFKCFIYCTKPSKKYQTICGCTVLNTDELYRLPSGEIKHDSSIELMAYDNYTKDNFLNGKVIGEFVCDKIDLYDMCESDPRPLSELPQGHYRHWLTIGELDRTCLSARELEEYLDLQNGYGWHISDLKIYDKPKELREFRKPCLRKKCSTKCISAVMEERILGECMVGCDKLIKRAPQSWCFVEVK